MYKSNAFNKRSLGYASQVQHSSRTKREPAKTTASAAPTAQPKHDKSDDKNSSQSTDKPPKPTGPIKQWNLFASRHDKDQFKVEALPFFNFTQDIGYASQLKLSKSAKDDRQLFYYYLPQRAGGYEWSKTLTVWLGGCEYIRSATLSDFFKGIGPIYWPDGNDVGRINTRSLNNVTDVLFLECQTGVAYGLGRRPRSWAELVGDLVDGLIAFYEIYPELKDYDLKFAGTGASLTVMAYLIDWQTQGGGSPFKVGSTTIKPLPVEPTGIFLQSPWIDGGESINPTTVATFERLQSVLGAEDNDIAKIKQWDQQCGYGATLKANLHYPGKTMPTTRVITGSPWPCDTSVYSDTTANVAFIRYGYEGISFRNVLQYAALSSASNENSYEGDSLVRITYWNLYEVMDALHLPMNSSWANTGAWYAKDTVYPSDGSAGFSSAYGDLASMTGSLGRALDAVDRAVFVVGDMNIADAKEAVAYAMQNITWRGKTGFDKDEWPGIVYGTTFENADPNDKTPERATVGGRFRRERGVTLASVKRAGADIAENAPVQLFALFVNFIHPDQLTGDPKKDGFAPPELP